jgi:hypothetical protein
MTEESEHRYCVTLELDIPDTRDQNEIENHSGNLALLHLEDNSSDVGNNPQATNNNQEESHAELYIEDEFSNSDESDRPNKESESDLLFISEDRSTEETENRDQEKNLNVDSTSDDYNDDVPQFQVVYSDEEKISDDELPDSLAPCRGGERRESKWSATILFVASEVQLIIDLAEFCPPEGYLTEPSKVGSNVQQLSYYLKEQFHNVTFSILYTCSTSFWGVIIIFFFRLFYFILLLLLLLLLLSFLHISFCLQLYCL